MGEKLGGKAGKGIKPVPNYCQGMCEGYKPPSKEHWKYHADNNLACIPFKQTIMKCFKRYKEFLLENNKSKHFFVIRHLILNIYILIWRTERQYYTIIETPIILSRDLQEALQKVYRSCFKIHQKR